MNGFIAKVGCQTLVFETVGSLLGSLGAYLNNPEQTEKEYTERFGYQGGEVVGQAVPNNQYEPIPVRERLVVERGYYRDRDRENDARVAVRAAGLGMSAESAYPVPTPPPPSWIDEASPLTPADRDRLRGGSWAGGTSASPRQG